MRIGILTFHYAYNYGAVLQCFALQEYVKSLPTDIQVEIIDYRAPAISNVYKWFFPSRFICKNPFKIIKKICREFVLTCQRKKRYEAFDNFITSKFSLAPISNIIDNPYDLIIVGSDQVWNINLTNGFDEFYWGDFMHPNKTRIISYAVSMQDNWESSLDKIILNKLSNFCSISVRESTIAKKILSICPTLQIETVVDPTLLLSQCFWNTVAIKPEKRSPYLLLYQVEFSQKTVNIANEIASRLGLEIINLELEINSRTPKDAIALSPEKFLGYFKYADYIVCSSFHGTIFSLQFEKPFVSIRMRMGKDNRVKSLLDNLNMSERFIDSVEDFRNYPSYSVNQKLEELRKNSCIYLIDNILQHKK